MKTHLEYQLTVFQTADELNIAAADFIIDLAKRSVAEKGKFVIALSGGRTPQKLFSLMSQILFSEQMPWKNTFVFWSDERCVPFDDQRNNAQQAISILLRKVNIPLSNIHRIPVDLSPLKAADKYVQEIKEVCGNEICPFDLILLGLGENGHTASLFPETKVESQSDCMGVVFVKEEEMFRVTMTARLINAARNILFLVIGESKSGILKEVLNGPYRPDQLPAQLIKPLNGRLIWFVDSDAYKQMS